VSACEGMLRWSSWIGWSLRGMVFLGRVRLGVSLVLVFVGLELVGMMSLDDWLGWVRVFCGICGTMLCLVSVGMLVCLMVILVVVRMVVGMMVVMLC